MFDCESVTVKPFVEKEVRTEPDADEANQSRCTLFFLPSSFLFPSSAPGAKLPWAESF